jgi:hypothetical protein
VPGVKTLSQARRRTKTRTFEKVSAPRDTWLKRMFDLTASVFVVKTEASFGAKTCGLGGSIGSWRENHSSRRHYGRVSTPAETIVTLAAVAMTHEDEDANEVFGSLPRRRPSIESPRRAAARQASPNRSTPATPPPAARASRSEVAELEELAVAGARLAAGAAASGLRLAGKTVGGLGRVVGRL